ncbi:CBN-SYM-3 protein [Caenorhabditis brenneri]|uniref:CBN-SYM-3 protein n=1 Tax=Caenorhabditis brenneri TaxID=135651 RepID=G0M6J6_CAEBE|nr:CBN-SYM-3 protein [Caenorhabditis brenneri]
MAFIKRKTVKFSVDLQVCHLSDVPLVNATVFGKMRLLDGGSFEEATERVEVKNHSASFNTRFVFCCRIPCDQNSGTLEKCLCRVSIRKEQKGGKSFYKLGFVDINLSEYAASGVEGMSRTYLLNGYTSNQRLDNSKVCIKIAMAHQSADPFFRVPRLSTFGPREIGGIDPDGFRADDDTDSEEGTSSYPKPSIIEAPMRNINIDGRSLKENASAASNSQVEDPTIERRGGHQGPQQNCQVRRFSQDRSAHKIQHSRFDPDNIVEKVITECRVSEDDNDANNSGLVLEKFLDQNGKPLVTPRQLPKRTSYVAEHFKDV